MFHSTIAAVTRFSPHGAVALRLKPPIPDLPEAIGEDRPGKRVSGLTLVQTDVYAAAQFDVLQPVKDEQGACDVIDFTQGDSLAILPWIVAELTQHQRDDDVEKFRTSARLVAKREKSSSGRPDRPIIRWSSRPCSLICSQIIIKPI